MSGFGSEDISFARNSRWKGNKVKKGFVALAGESRVSILGDIDRSCADLAH